MSMLPVSVCAAACTLYVMGFRVSSSQGAWSWLRFASTSMQGSGVTVSVVLATNINAVPLGSVSGGNAPFFTISTPPESPRSSIKAPGCSGMCARWVIGIWVGQSVTTRLRVRVKPDFDCSGVDAGSFWVFFTDSAGEGELSSSGAGLDEEGVASED